MRRRSRKPCRGRQNPGFDMSRENKTTTSKARRKAKAPGTETRAACPSTSSLLTDLNMPVAGDESSGFCSLLLPGARSFQGVGEAVAIAAGPGTAVFPASTALQAILRERTREIMAALWRKADYLVEHSRRVGILSAMVARDLGLPRRKIEDIQWVGSLHDAGKLAVSGGVLRKPGRLLREEYEEIKSHPVHSQSLIAPLAALMGCPWAPAAVRHHHERMDGGGYPDGLSGTEIPLEARIIAVCDSYDAMAGCRPYQGSLSEATIRENLVTAGGSQLDETVVGVFLDNLSYYRERTYSSV